MLAVAVALALPAAAEETRNWNISGFGTIGSVSQFGADGWLVVRNTAQSQASGRTSATPDSRLGVQWNWTPTSQWEAAVQAVALKKPQGAKALESVEWAYVGFRPLADTRLRLGRTSPDVYLFSDSRNVGFALPWVRPPMNFYGFAPVANVDGLDVEQRWAWGDARWRTRLTLGSLSVTAVDTQGQSFVYEGRRAVALGVSREEGPLLLKASYVRNQARISSPGFTQLRGGLAQLAALPLPGMAESIAPLQGQLWNEGTVSYFALGAQYEQGPWMLIGELSDLSVPGSPLNGRRAYVTAAYRLGDISYYGVASRVRPKDPPTLAPDLASRLTPVLGPQGAAGAQMLADGAANAITSYRFDQSSVGAGLRWDFHPSAALKLQVDRFTIHPYSSGGWVHGNSRGTQGTLLTVAVDFVWGQ